MQRSVKISFIYSFLQSPEFASNRVTQKEVTCSLKAHSDANFAHHTISILHKGCLWGEYLITLRNLIHFEKIQLIIMSTTECLSMNYE